MRVMNVCLRVLSLIQRHWNSTKIAIVGSKGTIFVFHEIDTENRYDVEPSSFCSVDMFRQVLAEHKEQFCSLDEFLTKSTDDSYVVTFDDVPESVYLNAYPILCEHQVPFVLYLSPKFIGKKGFLSVAQIQEMAKNPLCTIGAHTMNHVKLRLEANSYDDIYQSKVAIEAIVDKSVVHLAYPYGRADSISCKVRKEAKRAGFITATCTIPTKVSKWFNWWYIPRITVC